MEVRDRPDTSAASVTSERDGQRVTRTVTISAGGKVSVGGETAPDNPRGQVEIPGGQGVVLDFVAPDGPASRAGLAAHDILLTLDSKPVTGVDDFRDSLRKAMPAPEPKQEE